MIFDPDTASWVERDAANPHPRQKGGRWGYAPGGTVEEKERRGRKEIPVVMGGKKPPKVVMGGKKPVEVRPAKTQKKLGPKGDMPGPIATTSEAKAATEAWSDDFLPNTTPEQQQSLLDYAGTSNSEGRNDLRAVDINRNIRTGGELRTYDANIRDNIDSAFQRPGATARTNLTLQRDILAGDAARQLTDLHRNGNIKGTRVTDRAYVAGTMDPQWGGAGGPVRLRLSVPRGNPAIPLADSFTGNGGAGEVLLPRDTIYTITGSSMAGDQLVLDAEVQAR